MRTVFWLVIILVFPATGLAAYAAWTHGGNYEKGFNIGGSVASIFGIAYALIQVVQTKDIALATKEASEKAIKELKKRHYRNSLQTSSRLLSNVKLLASLRKWSLASLRADDLADGTSQIAHAGPEPDEQWAQVTTSLREWSAIFQKGRTNQELVLPAGFWASWTELCAFIQVKIDSEYDPLE